MFSPAVLDHFHNPRNVGPLADYTHRGVAGSPGDGPYMILSFIVEQGIISRGAFETYGCPSAVACGSVICEVLMGKPVDVALKLESADIIRLLGGIPEGKEHSAELVVEAIRGALSQENTR
jgi:nitrogen fixation NifU-like protein